MGVKEEWERRKRKEREKAKKRKKRTVKNISLEVNTFCLERGGEEGELT